MLGNKCFCSCFCFQKQKWKVMNREDPEKTRMHPKLWVGFENHLSHHCSSLVWIISQGTQKLTSEERAKGHRNARE